jgi:DNA-directed DNA polymerase III PolC
MSPEELVNEAARFGLEQLVLTDINNSGAMPDFVRLCRNAGIKPIGGMDFRDGHRQLFVGIAKNKEGMRELNEFMTVHLQSKTPVRDAPRCRHAYIVYPMDNIPDRNLFEYEMIGVRPAQVNSLIRFPYQSMKQKLVVLHSVSIGVVADFSLHCHLRAIAKNILYSQLKPEFCARREDRLVSADKLFHVFRNYECIIQNTQELLSNCELDYDFKAPKNRTVFSFSREDDLALLRQLAYDGLKYRYSAPDKHIQSRLDKELKVIEQMGFAAYFLIAWDIVKFSMSKGFYHVGRGSGANSLVAYCLKITDVDPIELDLYFERFLNPKRTSPPDFDIDYSWKDRNQVRDYVFKRYGNRHTALLGTISTFKTKSILRELSKVQGLPKEEIDDLAENPQKYQHKTDAVYQHILRMATRLSYFPNQRSVHAGGILVSAEPLTYYTALDLPPLGYSVTQWDMYVAEEIGYDKFDILSQRGIGHINEAADIISRTRGYKPDIHNIRRFKQDKLVQKQLYRGETIGCFYIESPAMRGLLAKLRCRDYKTLVAASSIIRPGVAKSGMMKEYIRRFHHPDKFQYLHPVMKSQLEETYGVMVYQEDVLKVCHHFAGLDLADADILRRAMSGKYRSKKEFQQIVTRFFVNCRSRGYSETLTREVWRQIESFAGYAFSKAHSASYAVESFQSLYLKAYYPLEFMVAVINNFGGFYQAWLYFNEAKRLGAKIELPCVNRSQMNATLSDDVIFIGFVHVSGLEQHLAERIITERENHGLYKDLFDFIQRIRPEKAQMQILIRVGALRFTQYSKAMIMWKFYAYHTKLKPIKQSHPLLFHVELPEYDVPELNASPIENAWDELEILGFPVTCSWFEMISNTENSGVSAVNLLSQVGSRILIDAVRVTIKYVKTKDAKLMFFGFWMDLEGNYFDTVHFPDSIEKYPFRGHGVYRIEGIVVADFGHPSVEVSSMLKLSFIPDPRSPEQ